jgi:hypothetical protein
MEPANPVPGGKYAETWQAAQATRSPKAFIRTVVQANITRQTPTQLVWYAGCEHLGQSL